MCKINCKDFTFNELEQFIVSLGEQKFRAKQIFQWLYRGVETFDQMTDLSLPFRKALKQKACISTLTIRKKLVSQLDGTIKYLFSLPDGNLIESVVMFYKHGTSICISSQVGCRMGCRFCASTLKGLVRSLTPGEMIDQILYAQKDIGRRISNIVMMGIGEPLDNLDNVLKFLNNVNHPLGLNIGYRHIALSTCGIVPQIRQLSEQELPITLSISLHAPNDTVRKQIMPVANQYSIDKLLAACKEYQSRTGRRITFEYTLIDGLNDTPACAKELVQRLRGLLCHVNLIPVNAVEERNYQKSGQYTIEKFQRILEEAGYAVTVRRELGSDIMASCGQLRQNHL